MRKIGEVFRLIESGNRICIQFVGKNQMMGKLFRVFDNCEDMKLDDFRTAQEAFMVFLNPSREEVKHDLKSLGMAELPLTFKLPSEMKTNFIDNENQIDHWVIMSLNTDNEIRKTVLNEYERTLSPMSIWSLNTLTKKLNSGWSLDKWSGQVGKGKYLKR